MSEKDFLQSHYLNNALCDPCWVSDYVYLRSLDSRRWHIGYLDHYVQDESQNLTASQLKTIITRCGEGTKLICSGNFVQIDSNYLSAVTSGLTYIVEKFKNFSGSATINLDGVVRSRLAEFAEEQL